MQIKIGISKQSKYLITNHTTINKDVYTGNKKLFIIVLHVEKQIVQNIWSKSKCSFSSNPLSPWLPQISYLSI